MDLIGQTIGNYQILEELGRGGMAVVYKAYQPSLNRYVALKVLPYVAAENKKSLHRFQAESQAAASVEDPLTSWDFSRALEALRVLKESSVALQRPLEAVSFSDEEGRFGGLFGSQSVAGLVTPEYLHAASDLDTS